MIPIPRNKAPSPCASQSFEQGNAAFYVLLFLPLSLVLTAIAVDVSGWNALRSSLQIDADNLALQAANALPNETRATEIVTTALAFSQQTPARPQISFPFGTHAAVEVTLTATYRPSFDFLIKPFLRTDSHYFRVQKQGTAQIVPTDYVLIIADGASLRPGLKRDQNGNIFDIDEPWGENTEWPASNYFLCALPPTLHSAPLGWMWWKYWSDERFQRWATQSCFNPVLTPLKLTAIRFAQVVLGMKTNRLSVIFTPGATPSRGYFTLRHIHGENEAPEVNLSQIGGFLDSNQTLSEAHWENYREFERFLSDESCFLFSNPETSLGYQYELPPDLNAKKRNTNCVDPLKTPVCGQRHFAEGHFADCYIENSLSISEAIYWHAARGVTDPSDSTPNIFASLQQSYNELLAPQTSRGAEIEKTYRGNLWQSNLRHVIVLTDHLPRMSDGNPMFTELFKAFRLAHIQLTIIAFQHPGLNPLEAKDLESNARELQALQNQSDGEQNYLRVTTFVGPEALEEKVLPLLLQTGRQLALRS